MQDPNKITSNSASRKVLGRGLANLFPPLAIKENEFLSIGIEKIKPNSEQPRKHFDPETLKTLADSIRLNGLIQPIVVRAIPNGEYEIIAGERRWRAAGMAGLHKIPARVWSETKETVSILALVENMQRQNLNLIEQAKAYKNIMQQKSWTQDYLAHKLSIPRASLANQLRLLHLTEEVQALIKKGLLSFAHAKLLLKEKQASKQYELANLFVSKNFSIREAEKYLSKKQLIVAKTPNSEISNWQKQTLKKLQETKGIKATLNLKKQGGVLNIRFFSEEDLKSILDCLL